MKIGLGLYPHLLTPETYRFACQAGVTHVVAHLPGFARREGRGLPPGQYRLKVFRGGDRSEVLVEVREGSGNRAELTVEK